MRRKLIALTAGVALAVSVSAVALAYPSADTMVSLGWDGNSLTYSVTSSDPTAAASTGVAPLTVPDEGTINHGTLVSGLAKTAKGLGFVKGCLMRHLAGSGWPADTTTSSISATCGTPSSAAEAAEDHGPPAHVAEKRQLRATSGWTPGDGPPPWANGDGSDD